LILGSLEIPVGILQSLCVHFNKPGSYKWTKSVHKKSKGDLFFFVCHWKIKFVISHNHSKSSFSVQAPRNGLLFHCPLYIYWGVLFFACYNNQNG